MERVASWRALWAVGRRRHYVMQKPFWETYLEEYERRRVRVTNRRSFMLSLKIISKHMTRSSPWELNSEKKVSWQEMVTEILTGRNSIFMNSIMGACGNSGHQLTIHGHKRVWLGERNNTVHFSLPRLVFQGGLFLVFGWKPYRIPGRRNRLLCVNRS